MGIQDRIQDSKCHFTLVLSGKAAGYYQKWFCKSVYTEPVEPDLKLSDESNQQTDWKEIYLFFFWWKVLRDSG